MVEGLLQGEVFCHSGHIGYINSLDIDSTDHQLLLCGGSDSAISIWDVDVDRSDIQTTPLCKLDMKIGHDYGLSKVQWWPFDQSMFFTGSFDFTVKVWDSSELDVVYSFDFENKVYNFDVNRHDENGLIAVGLSTPLIRLVDLRSVGSIQTLKGHHGGSVLSVKWSPTNSNILASAGSDGTVRIWDIRQANQQLASLDLLRTNLKQSLTDPEFRKAHRAVSNGLAWHYSGSELLSLGLDNKARVWSELDDGGVNKSINFGPLFQDRRQQTMDPCVSLESHHDKLVVSLLSDTGDILKCSLEDGKLIQRLVPPGKEARHNRQASFIARGSEINQYFSSACDGSIVRWFYDD